MKKAALLAIDAAKWKLIVEPISAQKRMEVDNFEHGCIGGIDILELELSHSHKPCSSVVPLMSELVGCELQAKDIYAMDPNYYRDLLKGGGSQVATDNVNMGCYRVEFDRLEDVDGNEPNKAQLTSWKEGVLELYSVVYELHFKLRLVGVNVVDLAELLGIGSH